jgi:hypothetical protein
MDTLHFQSARPGPAVAIGSLAVMMVRPAGRLPAGCPARPPVRPRAGQAPESEQAQAD